MRKFFFSSILFALYVNMFAQIINGRTDVVPNYRPQQTQQATDENTSLKSIKNHANKTRSKNDTINRINIVQAGVGGLLTSSNFFRNDQLHTLSPAFSGRLYYQPTGFLRFVLDYSMVEKTNIIPTWLNIKNSLIDIDAHFLMHFNNTDNRSLVYFILGATSQIWKGYYTGIDDINYAIDLKIQPNTDYKAIYFGACVGLGFEYKILPRLDVYGEVRFRIMNTDVAFGLSDVCYGAGLKYTLLDIHPKAVYKKPGKHFKWF